MKKNIFLLVVLFLLVFSLNAGAQNLEFIGGVTHNTISFKETEIDGSYEISQNSFSGMGYYLGGRYWLNGNWAIGLGYDCFWAYDGEIESGIEYYDEDKYGPELKGLYIEAIYKMNEAFNLSLAIVSYNYTFLDWDEETGFSTEDTGKGTGFILRGEFVYPVFSGFDLEGMAGYRHVNIDSDYDDDMLETYGLTFSLGLSHDF
ncbi:MAG: outer membrane beta-barrel protein [Halanaerobium sp.]|nr:outer membrane beta-barrel protein [Halanaerobium sp.]